MTVLTRPADARSALVTLGAIAVAVPLALVAVYRPLAGPAAIAVAAFVLVCLLRTDVALLALIAVAPVEEGIRLSGNPNLSVTKLLGALCLASFALRALRSRQPLVLDGTQLIVLGILGVALVSMLHAAEASEAMTTAARYAAFALVYVVLTQFAGDEVFLRRVAWVVAAAATWAAIWGLRDYFAGVAPVATVPFKDPGDFAFALATSLPLTFWLLGTRNRLLRAVVAAGLTVIFAAIVLSLVRGALVGITAGLLFFIVTDRRRWKVILAGGALALAAAAFVIHSDPARFENALGQKEHVASYNVTSRFDLWGAAATLLSENPVVGVGPGNFRFNYQETAGLPQGTHNLNVAHNAYLDIGAELGLIAMLLFGLYLAVAFLRATAEVQRGLGPPGYAQALRVSLVIAATSAMFLSEQYYLPFWLLGALVTIVWAGRREDAVPAAA
jgi:putative inorganic carbon (hco3(-)) transporter